VKGRLEGTIDALRDRAETSAADLTGPWRELAELRENPFLTPEWYEAWLATHPADQPFVAVWRDEGGDVRGVLPLVRATAGPTARLRFAGARRGDWFTPACRVEDEERMGVAVGALLARERSSWQLAQLDRVDRDSRWLHALWAQEGSRPLRGRLKRTDVLPYIRFDGGGYEDYLAARSRNFRSQLGRRRRKLEAEHGLAFRMTAEAWELDADLEVFFELHEQRWRDRGGSSALSDDAKQLHRRFAAAALERGWLRLWTAEADGVPAASWYGWRIGDRYCYSLSGLGDGFERLALGTVLLAHTIERAAAEGAAVYDLMWGDEDYKRRFETDRRYAETWLLGRSGSPAWTVAVGADRMSARARRLPPRLRDPARRIYRAAVRS
jgi:CelD/BcsL family acetyltransferase involved in cellulose biosynthesis